VTAPINPQTKDRIMTELAIPEQQYSPAVPAAPEPRVVRQASLTEWAREADVAFRLAEQLAKTSFVPATMKGNVDNITACLLAGNELGLPPMAALKSMDVIHGVVGLRAHAMRGLVQSHGHEIEIIESTATVCQIRGRRKGTEEWQTSVWTIGRAQLAGYAAKNAMYRTVPTDMLAARSTGEVCRWIASDVLHGVPYNTDELRDFEPPKTTTVRVGAPVTAAEILGTAPAPVPELTQAEAQDEDEPTESEYVDEATPDAPPLTGWQTAWREVGVIAGRLGWTEAQAIAEFEKKFPDTPHDQSSVDDLGEFAAHLLTLGGAE
jgi:hypothetical protein